MVEGSRGFRGGMCTGRADAALSSNVKLGFLTIVLGIFATVLAVYVTHSAIPNNPVKLPLEHPTAAREIMPEGWAFFTSSPETVYPQAMIRDARGGWHFEEESIAVPSGLFGVDRSQRARGTELSLVLATAPPHQKWSSCSGAPAICLAKLPVMAHLVNHSHLRDICGSVGFVRQEVLPWAYRRTGTIMPSKVLRAWVAC